MANRESIRAVLTIIALGIIPALGISAVSLAQDFVYHHSRGLIGHNLQDLIIFLLLIFGLLLARSAVPNSG